MLVPEPENEHDSHAIAIKLLDGTSLGYVPRDVNQSPLFPRLGHVTFGHVRSVGNPQSSPEMHGAIVSASHTLFKFNPFEPLSFNALMFAWS